MVKLWGHLGLALSILVVNSAVSVAGPGKSDPEPIAEGRASVRTLSYEDMVSSAWLVPPLRPEGFLFEVQALGYGPFSLLRVARSARKYELGDVAPHQPGGSSADEWGYSFHHLKAGAKDGAGRTHLGGYPSPPATRADALAFIHQYLLKTYVAGKPRPWSSMNGHYPYHHYAAEWGFDVVGSEIGENINSYQMHFAFNRGAARQYHKPWFVDVSPWHGPGITDFSQTKPWGDYSGPDRGHSRSLYRRAYFTAYMAGAGALVAEAGGINFFLEDMDEDGLFVPSPLGKMGQEFYRFTQRHPDPGVPYTPFGIVLDFYHGSYPGWEPLVAFGHFPYTAGDRMTWELLDLFFPGGWQVQGKKEASALTYTPYGDTVDILLQNAPQGLLNSYPALLLSGELHLKQDEAERLVQYVRDGGMLLVNVAYRDQFSDSIRQKAADAGILSQVPLGAGTIIFYGPEYDVRNSGKRVLDQLLPQLVPFEVSGRVEYLLNRRADSWVLTLVNNEGVLKDFYAPPVVDESGRQVVTVEYHGEHEIVKVTNWITDAELPVQENNRKGVTVELSPGDLAVLEFTLKR